MAGAASPCASADAPLTSRGETRPGSSDPPPPGPPVPSAEHTGCAPGPSLCTFPPSLQPARRAFTSDLKQNKTLFRRPLAGDMGPNGTAARRDSCRNPVRGGSGFGGKGGGAGVRLVGVTPSAALFPAANAHPDPAVARMRRVPRRLARLAPLLPLPPQRRAGGYVHGRAAFHLPRHLFSFF